jgi:hypothetical protein
MKKQAATLLVLALVALPGLLNAQIRTVIKADVPFEFVANGKVMPAGPCTIEVSGDGQTLLWIKSGSQRISVAPNATESVAPSAETALLFHKYGGRYFLAGINREGENRGYELPAGRVETELRAQNVAEGDVMLLASAK